MISGSAPAFTAFMGEQRLASGPLAEVALRRHEGLDQAPAAVDHHFR